MRKGWRRTDNSEQALVRIRLKKRILDDQIAEATPMLEIFAVKDLATAL